MANNGIYNDQEYYKKFVNYGNDKFLVIQKPKRKAILLLVLYPMFGTIVFFVDRLDFFAAATVLAAIAVCGIVCTIASDKWFSGNRDRLFLTWLIVTWPGIASLVIAMTLAHGISNMLILVFIAFHVVVIIVVLKDIVGRISSKELHNENRKIVGVFCMVSCSCLFGGVFLMDVFGGDAESGMVAAGFLVASTTTWMGFEILFKLHYAVAYNIDVINVWDPQQYGLKEEYQCPLLRRTIEESLCTKINYENEKMLKQDKLRAIKKTMKMTSGEIRNICKRCKHYPLKGMAVGNGRQ